MHSRTSASVGPSRTLVLYGDFSCPMCYLASQGVDVLAGAGVAVQWRAVEHSPELPVTGLRYDAASSSAVERALGDARTLLRPGEQLPAAVPAMVPKTEAAVSAYAEACGAGVSDEIRRLLFTAYWEDGVDIGNPLVLHTLLASTFMRGTATSDPIRRFGYAVSVSRGPITSQAWRRIRSWRQDWQALGTPELPSLWDGARVKSGARALRQLAVEVSQAPARGAAIDGASSRAKHAGWRPPTTVCPPATWVSQVGDPWLRAYRMSH